jgi:hypothetical protein
MTLAVFPATFLLITIGFFIVCFLIMIFVHFGIKKMEETVEINQKRCPKADNESSSEVGGETNVAMEKETNQL